MTRRRVRAGLAGCVATMCLGNYAADAQVTTPQRQCYRFDRQYFWWVGETPAGDSVYVDSSSVVALSPEPHPSTLILRWEPSARVMLPPAMPEGEATRSRRELSFWRLLAPDSVQVAWLTGFAGTRFRLQVRGDTLRGRVRFTTDVVGREPRFEDAWAVRILCPDRGRAPPNKPMQQTALLSRGRPLSYETGKARHELGI